MGPPSVSCAGIVSPYFLSANFSGVAALRYPRYVRVVRSKASTIQRIVEILIESGRVSASEIGDRDLIKLIKDQVIDELDFVAWSSVRFGLEVIDVSVAPEATALQLVPLGLMRKLRVVPIATTDDTLTLALLDPSNVAAIEEVEKIADRHVEPVLAPLSFIDYVLTVLTKRSVAQAQDQVGVWVDVLLERFTLDELENYEPRDVSNPPDDDNLGVVPLAIAMFLHLRNDHEPLKVIHIADDTLFRQDANLLARAPRALGTAVIAQVRSMAAFPDDDPETGSIRLVTQSGQWIVRCHFLAHEGGEHMVLEWGD